MIKIDKRKSTKRKSKVKVEIKEMSHGSHILTHQTDIYAFGNKKELKEELHKQKLNLEKNGFKIEEYVEGSKILYLNKEEQLCIWEIRKRKIL